jgi:hypothetical protein
MARVINDKQFESVSALSAPDRYSHFVRQVADWQEVWSLRTNEGWVLLGDSEGHEYFPVWPHARYAEAFATDEFAGSQASSILLDEWLARCLPGLISDGFLIAVFPVAPCRGVTVQPEQLRADLERELQHYQ